MVIQFLFRRVGPAITLQDSARHGSLFSNLLSRKGTGPAKSGQWTEKLASSLDQKVQEQSQPSLGEQETDLHTSLDLALRLEGPYFSPADPSRYHTAVCIVAGTGISGAIAIAGSFNALHKSGSTADPRSLESPSLGPVWQRCIVSWSVREEDYVALPHLERTPDVEVQICLTGSGRPRLNVEQLMSRVRATMPIDAGIWTYISGPKGFIDNAKKICKTMPSVSIHAASWEI